jgi:hypothetical protein
MSKDRHSGVLMKALKCHKSALQMDIILTDSFSSATRLLQCDATVSGATRLFRARRDRFGCGGGLLR